MGDESVVEGLFGNWCRGDYYNKIFKKEEKNHIMTWQVSIGGMEPSRKGCDHGDRFIQFQLVCECHVSRDRVIGARASKSTSLFGSLKGKPSNFNLKHGGKYGIKNIADPSGVCILHEPKLPCP